MYDVQSYLWLIPALPAGYLQRVAVVETANNVFEYCGDQTAEACREPR